MELLNREEIYRQIYEASLEENVCAGQGAGSISSFAPEHMRGLYCTGSGGGYGLSMEKGGKVDKDSTPRPQKNKYAKSYKVNTEKGESYLSINESKKRIFESVFDPAIESQESDQPVWYNTGVDVYYDNNNLVGWGAGYDEFRFAIASKDYGDVAKDIWDILSADDEDGGMLYSIMDIHGLGEKLEEKGYKITSEYGDEDYFSLRMDIPGSKEVDSFKLEFRRATDRG